MEGKEKVTMLFHQESVPATRDRPIALPSETVIVETRFGTYEFAPQETITMPNGLIGFADQRLFGLGNLPAPVPADFKLRLAEIMTEKALIASLWTPALVTILTPYIEL